MYYRVLAMYNVDLNVVLLDACAPNDEFIFGTQTFISDHSLN